MLRRHDNWPTRLHAFLRARATTPYEHGINDCACFCQAAIIEMTGIDVMPGIDKPRSAMAAARWLIANGYRDAEGLAVKVLGEPMESARLAGRGDVISFAQEGETHLGIVAGQEAATPGRDGILWVPRQMWRFGWRV